MKDPWVLAVIATLSGWVVAWQDIQFIQGLIFCRFFGPGCTGDFITDAVSRIDMSRRTGRRVLLEAGGVMPGRSLAEGVRLQGFSNLTVTLTKAPVLESRAWLLS
ncbi:hypothetical protein GCM10027405_02770 [Arthrobacter alkaliphilus]